MADTEGNSRSLQQRHSTLWFSDGNIVLASKFKDTPGLQGTMLFRVHRSVLSMHSPVFKDMFDVVPVGGYVLGANVETYEGVPYAFMPDPAEHLQVLLKIMYGDFK